MVEVNDYGRINRSSNERVHVTDTYVIQDNLRKINGSPVEPQKDGPEENYTRAVSIDGLASEEATL